MNIYPKAFIFDLNGTMIDDMHYHAKAWFDILNNNLNANLPYDEVKKQMYGKNEELLERVFGKDHFTEEEMKKISMQKEHSYQSAFLPQLKLINGLDEFLQKAYAKNILLAIASAAIPFNIDFVLDNLNIRHYFKAIVSADDVAVSKPHPEVFLKAAQLLNVDPKDCIVFEDAPKGVESAANAGMQTVVITTTHEQKEFAEYKNVIAFVKDYDDEYLKNVFG
ncbi:MAG TPA: HAD family phosphatase [Puia sp.]|jgi:beta-phosphoglucomutase family hydrolase|nr:HAD family phosphatase [Puia sp.]